MPDPNDYLHCHVCNQWIERGETYVSVSVQREVERGQFIDMVGIAEIVFACHEKCVPLSTQVDLSRFTKSGDQNNGH